MAESDNKQNGLMRPLPRKPSVVWSAMKSVKTKLSLTDEGATPVNWKVVFLVFFSLFSSSFNITFIFPFLPEMILTFGYQEEEKGYYAGIVASALFVGRFLGSFFWGWISDKKGRKPIILITVLLNGLSSLLFGFTTNLYVAFFTRLLSGIVNGTVGTAKTILYEISDNTNQAVGMSIISVAWGSGIIIGPAVGGYLANPCKRYPDMFASEGFMYEFPYFLPGIVAFIICIVAFILDVFLLPETLNKKRKDIDLTLDPNDQDSDEKTSLHSTQNIADLHHKGQPVHPRMAKAPMAFSVENLHLESEGATFLAASNKELHLTRHGLSITDVSLDSPSHSSHKSAHPRKYRQQFSMEDDDDTSAQTIMIASEMDRHSVHDIDISMTSTSPNGKHSNGTTVNNSDNEGRVKKTGCCVKLKNCSIIKLIRQYDIFLAVMLYSVFSFSVIGVEEIITVWASTDVLLDGLGFEPNEIGAMLGFSSFPLLVLQLFLFPNLVRRLGIKKTLIGCSLVCVIGTNITPTLHLLSSRPLTLWPLLLVVTAITKLMVSCTFSCTGLLINNSTEPQCTGQVNGLAMTITAFARSVAPLFGGTLFSWTVGYASPTLGPPFDVSFVFVLFGLMYWVCAVWGVTIPKHLNQQKK